MPTMSPSCLFVLVILLILFRRIGAIYTNSTIHADSGQVWDSRFFPPNFLGETEVEMQTWRIVSALICGALAAALSSAGGVGGGGLYVPIFNLLLGFNSNTSAALSSCMILGGTLVTLIWYCFQRRADGLGPLIDYQVSLLCLSNVLLGISAGVFCNIASPSWLVTLILIFVLCFTTLRSFRNACKRWNSETCALQSSLVSSVPVKDSAFSSSDLCESHVDENDGNTCKNEELEKPLLEHQSVAEGLPQYPPLKIAILCIIWVAFLAVQIVCGSSDVQQNLFGIQTCGVIYWLVTLVQVPFAIVVTACIMTYFQKEEKSNEQAGDFPSPRGEPVSGGLVKMSGLPVYSLGAGFLGGMLGLGGGIIISPLLLETGMHPQVTAATCSLMVFFASSLSVIQFWLLGRIPGEYALTSSALSLVFSFIGLQMVHTIIVIYGRVSLTVFSLSIVMGISVAFMAFFGTWEVLDQIQQGDYMGFRSPC
ncbi:hypothetical protein L7F22_004890 [Adiantum nelumboides]|nr:hypothetical protein [Adiantum nelumboides]